jgi:hypothetical protein
MAAALQNVDEVVDPRRMAHRRGIERGVGRVHHVHVRHVAQAHRRQHPVRDHHALGPPRRARGVEEPGEVALPPVHDRRTGSARHRREGCALDVRHGDVRRRGQPRREVRRHEYAGRARIAEDPGGLPRVELVVDGHDRRTGDPRTPECDQEFGAVRHEERDPVARPHAFGDQRRGQRRRPVAKGRVVGDDPFAHHERGPVPAGRRRPQKPVRQIHQAPPRRH